MKFKFSGDISSLLPSTELLQEDLGFSIAPDGKEVSVSHIGKGFSAEVSGEKIHISYNSPIDFYRALSICIDALKNGENIRISQTSSFEKCGIMLDVSRGAVMKVEKVKAFIRRMARMGFNELLLYTEDVYEVKEYPYFGYMRGRYSEEELRSIVDYANIFSIETVPCIQTLGHLALPLRWAEFSSFKDQPAVLMIGEEKTYAFIEAMIKTVRRVFSTNKIHIGMDEAHGVGLGAYLLKHGFKDRFSILCEHLNRVLEICKKYDFEPMMWSDMFFRLGTANGEYYSAEAHLPENIASLIPSGVSQVYWDYYNNNEHFYNAMISEHKKMNCPVIFAGGVWVWSGPAVNNKQSLISTLPALKVCKEQGISHIIATLWGDDGSECDCHQALYGLQLFAEYNYDSENALSNLDKMFKICNGVDAECFKLLDIDDFDTEIYNEDYPVFGELESHIINTSKQALYQNPLIGFFDKNFALTDLKHHYKTISDKLDKVLIPEEFKTMFDVHKQLLKVLISKCDIGIRLKKSYDEKDNEELAKLLAELNSLAEDIAELTRLRKKLWFENSKPFGFEHLLTRLSLLHSLTLLASERVEQYLKGEINSIEELEEERLWYNSIERPHFMEYFSTRIMGAY